MTSKTRDEESERHLRQLSGVGIGAVYGAVMGYMSGYALLIQIGVGFVSFIVMGVAAAFTFVRAPEHLANDARIHRFAVVVWLASFGVLWQVSSFHPQYFHLAVYATLFVTGALLIWTAYLDYDAQIPTSGIPTLAQYPAAIANPGPVTATTGYEYPDPAATNAFPPGQYMADPTAQVMGDPAAYGQLGQPAAYGQPGPPSAYGQASSATPWPDDVYPGEHHQYGVGPIPGDQNYG